ncbi:MAG: hypothetical protein H0U55_01550 [Rubrobacteraceae bacterium]|nr:hypothetical protein [Rubrobacteraceae bacterium]
MTQDHRKPEAKAAQEVLLDDADFLKEIVERVLQEVLEALSEQGERLVPEGLTVLLLAGRGAGRAGKLCGHRPSALDAEPKAGTAVVVGSVASRGACVRGEREPRPQEAPRLVGTSVLALR